MSPWLDIIREFKNLSNTGIDLFSLVKKKLGNGNETSFWDDIWIADSLLKQLFPRLYMLELDKFSFVAIKVRDTSLISSFMSPPSGGIEEEQLHLIGDIIASVVLSNSRDRWIWRLDYSGDFSMKSVRHFIDDSFLPKEEVSTRWIDIIPIKVNIFAWKVCLGKLPTRLNLSLRGLDIPSILCPNCYVAVESNAHLFFSCDLSRRLSHMVSRWWEVELHNFQSYGDWLSWFSNLRFSKWLKDVFEGVWYVMWWVIWKFQNQVLFGKNQPRMDLLFDEITRLSFTWCSSRRKSFSIDWISWLKNPSSISL
nr:RNA-directed DNA polymerase, eukaryota [Tanacetum cinerariifolium]